MDPNDDRLDELIDGYLNHLQTKGLDEAADRQLRGELVAANPHLRRALDDFFEMHDRVQGFAIRKNAGSPFSDNETHGKHQQIVRFEEPVAGRQFGDYEIIKLIARGGMGVVYQARQLSLNRIVALKMILAGEWASDEDIRRFQTEAEAAAKLDHPYIVPIFEVGRCQEQRYFSMAYVDGPCLADEIEQRRFSPTEAAELMMKVAFAMAYAHEQGIIHRDLKPGNILLQPRDAESSTAQTAFATLQSNLEKSRYSALSYQPKITDFGLAKRLDGEFELTAAGQIVGTPGFMSPEQASGRMDQVDSRSDVYAIGAILYAMLTGKSPHHRENKIETIMHTIHEEPVDARELNRKLQKPLTTIVHKCLEKDRNQRYQSAREVGDDLQRWLQREPIVAQPAPWWARVWRWTRQRPALAVTLASLAIFYLSYLTSMFLIWPGKEPTSAVQFVSGLVLFWLGIATLFQAVVKRVDETWGERLTYLWASLDVVMFTAILGTARGAESPALVVYLVLVAGTGLRYRIGLVWMVCGVSLLGYAFLLVRSNWLAADSQISPSAPIYFTACLVITALVMHILLWRLRQLSSMGRG